MSSSASSYSVRLIYAVPARAQVVSEAQIITDSSCKKYQDAEADGGCTNTQIHIQIWVISVEPADLCISRSMFKPRLAWLDCGKTAADIAFIVLLNPAFICLGQKT